MQTWGRFLTALVVAPIAGGAAAFLLGISFVFFAGKVSERNLRDALTLASALGFWSLLICLAYVLVVGTFAFAYARATHRALSLPVALGVAIVAGFIPFTYIAFHKDHALSPGAWLFTVLALICSVATAWTFWRVAFAERAAA